MRSAGEPAMGPLAALPMDHVFATRGQPRSYRRHAAVYSSGDAAECAYLVVSGEVKLSRYTPDGRELTIEHAGPGAFFGEAEIMLDSRRESQAVARSDVMLQALDKETLLASVESDSDFGLWLTRQMSARQARLENRLESLLFKSATGKVAQLLLDLAHQHGQATGEGTLIDYPITHQEIGNLIATTRETVSYAFMEFRDTGLITTRRRKTIIKDMERLGQMAEC